MMQVCALREGGRQKKRKDEKILKKRAEKVMGFSSASIFPERKLEKGGNYDDKPPDAENNPGSRYCQRLRRKGKPRSHSRHIHVKQRGHERGSPEPPNN